MLLTRKHVTFTGGGTNKDRQLIELIRAATTRDADFWSSRDRRPRESAHALFQYPAMMVPAVQRRMLELLLAVQPGIRSLYDPFTGAGTSLVGGMHLGLQCFGRDINPLAVLVTRVKTGPFFCDAFARDAGVAVAGARRDRSMEIGATFPGLGRWFAPDVAISLSRLRRAIRSISSPHSRRFLWVTLAEVVRLTSNDRTSTYKLHRRSEEELRSRQVDPLSVFSQTVDRNLSDLREHASILQGAGRVVRGRYSGGISVEVGSACSSLGSGFPETFDVVVTSPPYGDNHSTVTYGQHSYLPLQWIDLEDIDIRVDPAVLRTTQEIDRRSVGGRISSLSEDSLGDLRARSATLDRVLTNLRHEPVDRAARVGIFFQDLDKCLKEIARVTRTDGYMVWTIGNRSVGGREVPNDQIISELLRGYAVTEVTRIERQIHFKRMAHRNEYAQTMRSERLVVFRKTEGAR